jgi:hypothetical protein
MFYWCKIDKSMEQKRLEIDLCVCEMQHMIEIELHQWRRVGYLLNASVTD